MNLDSLLESLEEDHSPLAGIVSMPIAGVTAEEALR